MPSMTTRNPASQYDNAEVSFVLIIDETNDKDAEEVEPETTLNFRNCVRLSMREAFTTEDNHTLHVVVNERFWLSDPLRHIQAAVESKDGRIKGFDHAERKFTVLTKDDHQLEICIHGGLQEHEVTLEEEVEEKKKTGNVVIKQEVLEILDTSGEDDEVELLDTSAEDSDSDSEYFDFSDVGLTQLVQKASGVPFKLPII
jgi:hypothetical protein